MLAGLKMERLISLGLHLDSDTNAKAVEILVKVCPNLTDLCFDGIPVSSQAVAVSAGWKRLAKLTLFAEVGNNSLAELHNLAGLTELHCLILTGHNFTHEGEADFRRQKPDVRLVLSKPR